MRPFLIFIAFLFAGNIAKAQHNHFIYLQADNKQPFYVKVKGNLYSSSPSGYLIIPKLAAGPHELSIGFPKNEWPAQTIPVNIAGKDLGYLLKNFDSKGWGLFNIQSMDVIMAASPSGTPVTVAQVETKTDPFSNELANVVNTPSIKEVDKKREKESKKEEPIVAVPVSDPIEVAKVQEKAVETTNSAAVAPPSVIRKLTTSQTGEASNITYLITDEYGSDTVSISIPMEKAVASTATSATIEKAAATEKPADKAQKQGDEPKFIEIDLPNPNNNSAASPTASEKPKEKPEAVVTTDKTAGQPLKMINSDCKTVAGEDDFLKTRKKMTAQKSDDAMVEAAKKLFRQKCYSTAQVRNLSVLFLKDEGKYKFFDAIYPFVYDSNEFRQLESQLSEEYYISRFRSMIRK
ncbi:MAG: DUF4476 domain-containing protein [Chitinophagaceae bacterium]|nr:MAG: DUF4476 domain-containing protein [Chitinophagaceae bacterium]